MAKQLTLLFCGFFLWLHTQAQTGVKGSVVDGSTGKPVAGATVEIGNITAVTDEQGSFTAPVQPGGYQVKITSIGYKSIQNRFELSEKNSMFNLERYNLFLQPVEIRAVRASDNAPFTKTNIGKRELEKNNLGQDLPFLLNQTPSVVINSDAGNGIGYTGIRIRGSDPTRINVTLNGIPYNDAESQGAFFVDLPDLASSVNSIQIQRGVGTSSNGAGAFGATINVSTNEFIEKPYAEINNSTGSFNTWKHTVKAGTGLLNDHFTIDARLSRVSSDGYIDRASSDLRSFFLSTAYFNKKSSLRLNVFSGTEKTYQAWNGILQKDLPKSRTYNSAGTEKPGDPYDNETDNYQQDNYQFFFNHQFNENLSFNTAIFLTRGLGYYEQYKAGESFTDYGLPAAVFGRDTVTNTDLVRQLWLDNYFYGNVFSFQYRKNKSQFTLGGGVNRYDGSHYGKVIWSGSGIEKDHKWYDLDARKTDVSFYGKLQQNIAEHWDLFGDLQYRHVDYNIDGFRNNPNLITRNRYNFLNPKAGISYSANNLKAYFSYALGNKEPNRDDFEAGASKQPRFETLNDFELGVEKKMAGFSWGVTGYYMAYVNQLALTGQINDVGAYTRTNIPRSYRAGVELQGSLRLLPWLFVNGNLTLSKNRVTEFSEFIDDYDNGDQKSYTHRNTPIAFSPDVVGSFLAGIVPFKNAEINLVSKYVGRQYLDNTGNKSRSLADYYVQDIRMMYGFGTPAFKAMNLVLQVNNLFNRMYEPNGYTYNYLSGGSIQTENYVFPMAGINWMVGVNVKL